MRRSKASRGSSGRAIEPVAHVEAPIGRDSQVSLRRAIIGA